tara:strand:- start:1041 stop:1220 length:180 start_codon:yes stop_codon:yes gene_type:complete
MTTKPDSVELALFSCLRYEEATLNNVDTLERWDINEEEKRIVLKWITNRMADIKGRING